jgi:aromatic ring-cleaving dioxygenase
MDNVSTNPRLIPSFHAHIYYSPETREIAVGLREAFLEFARKRHAVDWSYSMLTTVGKMHDDPIGPHTQPMFAVMFNAHNLLLIQNHLILHRNGLSVLIHPETGNELKDHTAHTIWLGKPVELDLGKL